MQDEAHELFKTHEQFQNACVSIKMSSTCGATPLISLAPNEDIFTSMTNHVEEDIDQVVSIAEEIFKSTLLPTIIEPGASEEIAELVAMSPEEQQDLTEDIQGQQIGEILKETSEKKGTRSTADLLIQVKVRLKDCLHTTEDS